MGWLIKNLEVKDMDHILGRDRDRRRVLNVESQEPVGFFFFLKRSFRLRAKVPVSRRMGKTERKETKYMAEVR